MITVSTVIELFNLLEPEAQAECRKVIAAASAPAKPKRKKSILRPEHATDELVYQMIIREKNIKFINPTNEQANGLRLKDLPK